MNSSTRLTDAQHLALLRPLEQCRVEKNESGHAYIPQWDVRAHLIKHFGFGGFDIEILDKEKIVDTRAQEFCYVVYEATVRLTIKNPVGRTVARWDEVAAAEATGYRNPLPKQLSLGQAYHTALTSAVSAALNRCVNNLGDQFGLSLYNEGSLDPVVGSTLLDPPDDIPEETEQGTLDIGNPDADPDADWRVNDPT